jgi:hypothetical protein
MDSISTYAYACSQPGPKSAVQISSLGQRIDPKEVEDSPGDTEKFNISGNGPSPTYGLVKKPQCCVYASHQL